MGRRELCVPQIELDRASGTPLYRQIYHQLARAIRCGAVPDRVRLPSTRLMARLLRVSRNTVLVAYDDLAAADLIQGKRGAGMWVKGDISGARTRSRLQQVIRAAGYPAKVLILTDPDGNMLYLHA